MYQIQNMKQQEKETIKEFLTRFRLMIRMLEVPPTDAQKITWLRNAVHQRFITSVEDRGYANADDFEDKLKTCAYSMAYRDGAFSNERDAYRRTDQESEDEHNDDSSGTRKKKREMRRQAHEPDVIPDSIPDDDLTPLRRWDKEDQVTKDTIDFIQEMQTSDEQEDVEVGKEGDYFPFSNMEPPEDDPNPVNPAIPENVWKKNWRRRTEDEPSNPGKRVRFTIEVKEPQAVEEIAKKLTKFLQQKAEITMQ
ncbi:hypothetical protein R1sor_012688 [Riccia sorocarpa]|uniref:Retrotransposon gag domain-containing protein n=1 Tax=Riccia sorocarpa TaxID=122646 RepID=A0ABD3I4H8_9MARC